MTPQTSSPLLPLEPAPASRQKPRRRFLRRAGLAAAGLVGLLALTALVGGIWFHGRLEESLPRLEGEIAVRGVGAAVTVERDASGIPTLRGASRSDVAFATGFVHAQDRFFQMDLLRRRPAGELAGLLGGLALEQDRANRPLRLRARAERALRTLPDQERALLSAYTVGVNASLAELGAPPFEYLLLRTDPEPWKPEDSVLVLLAMFLQMGDASGSVDTELGMMHDLLPRPLFELLTPAGTEWDAPLQGEALAAPAIPGPDRLDLRRKPWAAPRAASLESGSEPMAASNSWAVSGRVSADGGALLADELHLALSVPNIWYRASFVWPGAAGEHRVTGATLPGTPAMVVGSNGRVAWGVTNGMVDTSDVILLDRDSQDPRIYRTPAGPRRLERHREVLRLRGGGEEALDVDWTVWGPVIGEDHRGRTRVLRWIALEERAVDFQVVDLETAGDLDEALRIARQSGVPALNFTAADASGRIGWTMMGRLPRRVGFAGRLPGSWADGSRRWDGLLSPEEVPVITEPAHGRLWSGNNRPVSGEALALLPDGGYRLGARARIIRDALLAMDRPTVEDMRRLQLDNRAVFLERWRDLLLEILTPEALAANPRRRELREAIEDWGGHAAVDSVGFRGVRAFRVTLARDVFGWLTAPCIAVHPDFDYLNSFDQAEGPLWRLVSERPLHLLDPRYASWEEQLLANVDATLDLAGDEPLREWTWGARNTASIRHLLSPALPGAGRWLDMPAEQLPGSDYMPRVQEPSYGPTLRMIVSPGREAQGIFQMPGGQSGHPLSPHYRDAHAAWVEGAPAPFLPGPPVHRLRLTPGS